MIGRLRGEIVTKQAPYLLLEVNGVGYELEAPMSTFYKLPATGEPATLFTHLAVREDAHTLYAFATEDERELFRSLLKVNGVGAKMALAILSGMSAGEFAGCVQDSNITALIRIPGVGRKTAERLIIEMRDRPGATLPGAAVSVAAAAGRPASPLEDAVTALIALGYKPPEASRLVRAVDATGLPSEEIIRQALRAAANS